MTDRLGNVAAASDIPMTAAQLAERLEGAIVAQVWKPGAKLESERQLAERYRIGRPAVRETLRRLQERGLIVVQPGRGSFVRELRATHGTASAELMTRRGQITARQLARARQMLESESAALAAENRTEEELERMRRLLAEFDAASDVTVMAEFDLAFHEAIMVASGNVVMQIMFGSIRNLTHGIMLRSLTDRRVRDAGAPIHHTVFDAIEAQDPDRARAAMLEHLHLAETHYGADIDEPLADVLRRRADHLPEVADALRTASTSVERGDD
jgi:GntR family transcriptional regulator, transcriptional repressor for pyruvate dehydrogenase complex